MGAAARSLLRIAPLIQGVEFRACSYCDQHYPDGAVVYCDPPYLDTHAYANSGPFNSGEFWDFYAALSRRCFVFVSEYRAPEDWAPVLTIPTKTEVRTARAGREDRTEKLYSYRDGIGGDLFT